jgi:hypothetical protein
MRDFWYVAKALAEDGGPVGRQRVLAFPAWPESRDAKYFQEVLLHIQDCAAVCEYLGESLLIAGRHPSNPSSEEEPDAAPYPTVILRSFSQQAWGDFSTENFGEEDPFAVMDVPDDNLFDHAAGAKVSDAEAVANARAWLANAITQVGFAAGEASEGVAYSVTAASTAEQMFQSFWRSVTELLSTDVRERDATVLVAPRFATFNSGAFEVFASTLNDALRQLDAGRDVQLIFLHPDPIVEEQDKSRAEYVGEFARKSPHPMVVILRTGQVEEARAGASVGSVNTRTLIEIHERLLGRGLKDQLREWTS